MESKAQAAEALAARSSGQVALDNAILAIELYMDAAAHASTKAEGTRLRRRCESLFKYAELLKSQLASTSSPEEAILRDASRLHGNHFPQWKDEPQESDFQRAPGEDFFIDDAVFTLSAAQRETFGGWKRPAELFDQVGKIGSTADSESMLFSTRAESCDLVQDITTDCSVVAGLSAAIKVLIGKHSILSSIIHPFDHTQGRPGYSASGKYVMRFNFNGCARKVVVDDRLPSSLTERTLFVVDRANQQLLWPALLEKAYLKVRGGYDFPGSNSGTDLWVLTGWIPEQVFLQREDLDKNEVWDRIKVAHDAEDVVITIGTGAISPEEESATGLVGEHDYAVQGLREEGSLRQLLVKNPWCNGPVWAGGWLSTPPKALNATEVPEAGYFSQESTTKPATGAVWVMFDDVAHNFESMYLNWNPELFEHREQRHFSWQMPPDHLRNTLAGNPQFSFVAPHGGLAWILVSRHFQDAELEIVRKRTGSMAAAARQLGFMSILVFDCGGKRVQVSGEETYRGPYVDSPQTLARLDTTAGKHYTVVLDQHEFPLSKYSFSLSTFSHNPVEVQQAAEPMPFTEERLGTWNRRTAGGSAACSTYFSNPQYRIRVLEPTALAILLSTDDQNVYIHADLVWGYGKRVSMVSNKDLLATSGEYRRGCAVAEVDRLEPGEYTIVCSTFEADQLASFGLRVTSMSAVSVESIPADAAGRLRTPLPLLFLSDQIEAARASISVNWLTRASASVRKSRSDLRQSSNILIRLSIICGRVPNYVTLAESGAGGFEDPSVSLRTIEFDLEPERVRAEGMWLVIESMGQQQNIPPLEVELCSDSPIQVGKWEAFQTIIR